MVHAASPSLYDAKRLHREVHRICRGPNETFVSGKVVNMHLDKKMRFHPQAYADEQTFPFNNRKLTAAERFTVAKSHIVGRRLTYDEFERKNSLRKQDCAPEG